VFGTTMAVTIRPLLISQRPVNPVRAWPFTTGPVTSSRAANDWLAGSKSTQASSKPSQRLVSGNHAL
jgi:hypothetical protein